MKTSWKDPVSISYNIFKEEDFILKVSTSKNRHGSFFLSQDMPEVIVANAEIRVALYPFKNSICWNVKRKSLYLS